MTPRHDGAWFSRALWRAAPSLAYHCTLPFIPGARRCAGSIKSTDRRSSTLHCRKTQEKTVSLLLFRIMLIWDVLSATRVPAASIGGLAAIVLLMLFWFDRQLHVAVTGALSVVLETAETLTTGWSSPPLPADLPSPRGLPLLGSLPFLGRLPHKTLATVAERFDGRAFRLSAGSRRFVVISHIETLRQLADRYANQLRGKPLTFTTKQVRSICTVIILLSHLQNP